MDTAYLRSLLLLLLKTRTTTYTITDWCRLTFDVTVVGNTYNGKRLETVAYSCLRSRSFRIREPLICVLLPNISDYWGYHSDHTDIRTHPIHLPPPYGNQFKLTRDRRQKYIARGFTPIDAE